MTSSNEGTRLGILPRKLSFAVGEKHVTSTSCYRRWAGSWSAGTWHLTSEQLIWIGHLDSLNLAALILLRNDVTTARLQSATLLDLPHRWLMMIETKDDVYRFGFGGLPTKRQRAVTKNWVEIVERWARIPS
jgi:hypothetical protein